MDKFSNKLKTCFWPILGPFSQKIHKIYYMGSQPNANIQKNLMIQFQEDAWRDGKMDGRANIPYFTGPFRVLLGFQKGVRDWCTISAQFFYEYVSYLILHQLTNFQYHTFLLSQDIKQNVLLSSYITDDVINLKFEYTGRKIVSMMRQKGFSIII